MKQQLIQIALGFSLVCAGFLYGVLAKEYQVFPYPQLKYLKQQLFTTWPVAADAELITYPYWQTKTGLFNAVKAKADYVMIGDSITDSADWNELLPGVSIANRGINGDTSFGVAQRLPGILNLTPRQAFIMLGVNDIFRGRSQENIAADYTKILQALQAQHIAVVIQSTLYVAASFTDSGAVNRKVAILNAFLQNYADQHGLIFLDLNAKLAPTGALEPQLSFDGLHLNAAAYLIWRQALMAIL